MNILKESMASLELTGMLLDYLYTNSRLMFTHNVIL
jgi:hypothetical protein